MRPGRRCGLSATSLRFLAALSLLAGLGAQAEPAHRAVSLNLCTDQLVLALADRSQIAGVTRLAADCRISNVCAAALDVPALRGTAEEVVAARPDLVLAGPAGPALVLEAARRAGARVVSLPDAASLDAIRAQIGIIATALGQEARGAALTAAFDRRLAAVPQPGAGPRPLVAVYEPNGFLSGPGTLADAVLTRAGLDNLATRDRLGHYGTVSLEFLLLARPDLLVTGEPSASPSLAEAMLWHPALQDAFAGHRVEVPGRDWICGSPATLDALERLTQARVAVQR